MGKYIAQIDAEKALSAETMAQIYVPDPASGVLDVLAIETDIEYAEAEVDSYLVGVRDVAHLKRWDNLLRLSAIEFFLVFAFRTHPEYVRTYGENPRADGLYKRAQARMERIQAAVQELAAQPTRPANVGGIIRSGGPRMMIDGIDGTDNGSGF